MLLIFFDNFINPRPPRHPQLTRGSEHNQERQKEIKNGVILTLEHYQGTLKSVLLILEAYNERVG
jgi:hypothetical protein